MKRIGYVLLTVVFLLALSGCTKKEPTPTSDEVEKPRIFSSIPASEENVEYLWEVEVPYGVQLPPRPYLFIGEKEYYVRNLIPEVDSLNPDWEPVGTVNVSVDWEENTYAIDADENTIVSNCVSKGAKVYKWNYFVAVECPGFFVVFQESSFS